MSTIHNINIAAPKIKTDAVWRFALMTAAPLSPEATDLLPFAAEDALEFERLRFATVNPVLSICIIEFFYVSADKFTA